MSKDSSPAKASPAVSFKHLPVSTSTGRLPWAEYNFPSLQLACHSLTNGNDVAFVFPFEKSTYPPPVLWARRADLMALSSYFSGMFTGGFLESSNILVQTSKIIEAYQSDLAKVINEERAKGRPNGALAHASDDEDDAAGWTSTTALFRSPSCPIYYITVRDTSYRTYEAFLKWHLTRIIHFASLKTKAPCLYGLSGVSPKSVYRLAHQLDVKALQDLAVKNFEEQLTHSNVLEELFSPICFTYPSLKQAGLRALERNWGQIIASGGLDKLSDLVQSDDCDPKEIAMLAIEILKKAPKIGSQSSK